MLATIFAIIAYVLVALVVMYFVFLFVIVPICAFLSLPIVSAKLPPNEPEKHEPLTWKGWIVFFILSLSITFFIKFF